MDKYTLYTTAEECAEVTQAITKVLRFGLDQTNPYTGDTNGKNLAEEIGQLQYCLHRISRELKLDGTLIQDSYDDKLVNWNKWKAYYDR
jgi:NTP pyrophosphatase (non-canonical NTP hydrolase)